MAGEKSASTSPSGRDVAGLIRVAGEQGFVGRRVLLEWFESALADQSAPRMLFVHGPGGIGKTTLLEAFARLASASGQQWVYLDARETDGSAAAVESAMQERGAALDEIPVLLIDGFDLFAPLERWWCDHVLSVRPAESISVFAGRTGPRGHWWLGPGWSHLVTVQELGGLDAAESVRLLGELGVDRDRREPLAALARGYPLALALLAEAAMGGSIPTHLAEAPDVVAALCERVVDEVPDAAHRSGLQTCAHATRMTHDLLRHTVGDRADEVWNWLESRSYVRRGQVGLFLHDVVREAFEAVFIHRAPDSYSSLHRRIRDYFLARVFDLEEPHPDRAAAEILLLHRRTPLESQIEVLRCSGLPSVSRAAAGERDDVIDLIERDEGRESAALARRWLDEQPRCLYRVRSDDGVAAFAMHCYLPASDRLAQDDPVAARVLRMVEENCPLRPGERINLNRFAGASRAYQRDPVSLLVNGVSSILEWALVPAAWTFIITLEDDLYGPYFECLGMERMFVMAPFGRPYAGYGWDRRRFPPPAMFEMMARRELTGETGPPPESLLRPLPLSRADFATAVVAALRDLSMPEGLAASPLVGSGVLPPGAPATAEALHRVMVDAIASLPSDGRIDHRRVLERTYVKGAPSQEAAAEILGLPFSTYRRHLSRAQARLTDVLWATETG